MCDEQALEDPFLTLNDSVHLDYGGYGNSYLKQTHNLMMGNHLG